MNFKDFSEFFQVLWNFSKLSYSCLFFDSNVSFLVFSVLPRLISIVYKDFVHCWVFKKFSTIFSSVFLEFIRSSWLISKNYYFLFEFFCSFRFIEDLFWFSESFLWVLKIFFNFWSFIDIFELYGMFLISFGFLCIFFGLFCAFKIDFRSFIKTFLFVGFFKFF